MVTPREEPEGCRTSLSLPSCPLPLLPEPPGARVGLLGTEQGREERRVDLEGQRGDGQHQMGAGGLASRAGGLHLPLCQEVAGGTCTCPGLQASWRGVRASVSEGSRFRNEV